MLTKKKVFRVDKIPWKIQKTYGNRYMREAEHKLCVKKKKKKNLKREELLLNGVNVIYIQEFQKATEDSFVLTCTI